MTCAGNVKLCKLISTKSADSSIKLHSEEQQVSTFINYTYTLLDTMHLL